MKKLVLIFLAFINASFLSAQSFNYQKSDPFEEVRSGTLKIFQLENFNTVLFHSSLENEVTVRIFDLSRKLTVTERFYLNVDEGGKPSKYIKIKYTIKVQNDVVVFYSDLVDKTPSIYRAVIDGSSGRLQKNELLYQFESVPAAFRYSREFGSHLNFYVAQDNSTKNYAFFLNSLALNSENRVEIVHYNAMHEEVGRGSFNPDSEGLNVLDPIDMIVTEDGKVIICAAVEDSNFGSKQTFLFAVLHEESLNFSLKESEFLFNSRSVNGKILLDEENNYLTFVGLTLTSRTRNEHIFASFLIIFDPTTFETLFSKEIYLPNIDKKYSEIFGEKVKFNGLPQNFYVNSDGTNSIIFEEESVRVTSDNVYTTLGNIVVTVLDEKTHEIESHLVPKIHRVKMPISKFYLYKRKYEPQILMNGDQYKTCEFVVGKNGKYILFNDTIENLDRIEKGKQTTVTGVSFLDAFVYTVANGTMKRQFLFDEPEGREHNLAMFTVSDYDRESNSFATIMLTSGGRKSMSVVWVTL